MNVISPTVSSLSFHLQKPQVLNISSTTSITPSPHVRHFHLNGIVPFHSWNSLASEIDLSLSALSIKRHIIKILWSRSNFDPSNPCTFSYMYIQNVPVPFVHKLHIHATNSPIHFFSGITTKCCLSLNILPAFHLSMSALLVIVFAVARLK